MISLHPVTTQDHDILLGLEVDPAQKHFVASNAVTLAQTSSMKGAYTFAIRSGNAVTGLLAMLDFREHDDLFEGDDPEAAFMLRLMVGARFQRQGIGKGAVRLAVRWAQERRNSRFQTSIVPDNDGARKLYEGMGLRVTGRMIEDEVEMSLDLRMPERG